MRNSLQSLRSLFRSPGYTAAAVLTLGLGIGATTSMFSIIHGALLRPLPYAETERLFKFRDLYEPSGGSGGVTTPNYLDLQAATGDVAELAAYSAGSFNVAGGERPERIAGLSVSHNFFRVLGMPPAHGRAFAEQEDRAGRADVVVITHQLWQDRFGGRSDALGQVLQLDARPHVVVGVLPESFWFPGAPQAVIPFEWTPEQMTEQRGSRWMEGIGRLRPGVSLASADAAMKRIYAQLREAYPGPNTDWSVRAVSFAEFALGANRTSLYLLSGAVLLVLLIGALNVANLMLVRAERRIGETAVRIALGASRGRVARQYVGEGLLLSALGAGVGIALAWGATMVLLGLYGSSLPRAEQVGLSAPVLGFAAGLSLLVGLLVGLVPVVRLDVQNLHNTLRAGGRGGTAAGTRLQRALVVVEVAVAVILVTGAGLMIHSFMRLNRVDTGLNLDNALVFNVQLPEVRYETEEASRQFFESALREIEQIPGVVAAGITERTPLQGGFNITVLESPANPDRRTPFVEIRTVTPGYFEAAGIPLLSGRMITDDDVRAARPVVLLSDVAANALFPDGDGIGQFILPDWNETGGFEVIGTVGSVREFGVLGDKRPAIYWPFQAIGQRTSMTFLVSARGDPVALMPEIRRAIARIDDTLPIFGVRTMGEVLVETTGARWFATNLFSAFGVLALVLSALGIFAVLSFVVEQRTREIGIRMAVGATTAQVHRMVVGQGLRLVALGVVIGVSGALALSRLLSGLLFEVEPTDLGTLSAVVGVALVTAVAASYLPALGATRANPADVLRRQ